MNKPKAQERRGPPVRKRTAKKQRADSKIPSKSTIVSTATLISPKGRRYSILETNQMDPYDNPKTSARTRRKN